MLLFACVAASGCASFGFNYLDPELPRCAEGLRAFDVEEVSDPETFKFVSFNIKFGEEPEKATRTLVNNDLDDADVFVLQEMDLPSTRIIARELRLNYVYYPGSVHPKSGRQFGLAVLSPWPIRDDRKILLPRIDSSDDVSKIAVSSIVWVKGHAVGVVNAHLQSGLSPVEIGDQLQVLLGCVFGERCPQAGAPLLPDSDYIALAGDLNTLSSAHIGVAEEILGWYGLTRVGGIGRTMKYLFGAGRLDHMFVGEGLSVMSSGHGSGFFGTGSDHRPIWAELRFAGPRKEPWDGFDSLRPWETFPGQGSVCDAAGQG